MKFQPDTLAGVNAITRLEGGRVWVGGNAFSHSIVVPWRGAVLEWAPATPEALRPEDFEPIAALAPEVVIFGSGRALRFAAPSVLRPLIEAGIGHETMDTAAACRTYNVLVNEGRNVVAALLIAPG